MAESTDTSNKKIKVKFEREPTKEEIIQAKNAVSYAIYNLIHEHPLSYHIMGQCQIKCKPGLGTFGVVAERNGISLYYDPLFALKLHRESQEICKARNESPTTFTSHKLMNVLKHESIHLIFSHLTIGFPQEAYKNPTWKQIFNIALDFKVNENIPDIWNGDGPNGEYAGTCGHHALKELLSLDTVADKNCLDVYDLLKKKVEKEGGPGELPEVIDIHDLVNEDGSPLTEEQQQTILRRVIRTSADKLSEHQRALLPAEIKRAIDSTYLNKLNKHKWDELLKQFLCSIKQPKLVGTWKKPSRRYGFKAVGHKKDIKPSIAICLDTSGSMGDEALKQTLGVVKSLAHRFSDIWFIAGDAAVDYCELLSKCNVDMKLLKFASGGGGTVLQPLLDKAKEKKVNASILISDGYCDHLEPTNRTVGLVVPHGQQIPGLDVCFNFEEFL